MLSVYELNAYEEIYQKLSADLDTEHQCPYLHQCNQSTLEG